MRKSILALLLLAATLTSAADIPGEAKGIAIIDYSGLTEFNGLASTQSKENTARAGSITAAGR